MRRSGGQQVIRPSRDVCREAEIIAGEGQTKSVQSQQCFKRKLSVKLRFEWNVARGILMEGQRALI